MLANKHVWKWLCAIASLICVQPAFAISFADVQSAIIESRWDDADRHAQVLDQSDPVGDFLGIYVEAARLTQRGECEEAASLARALLHLRPAFAPAQELIFICSTQSGDLAAAQGELRTLLAILPEGPQRTILEQMLVSSAARTGPHFSAYIEARPSTNINRQTAATSIGPWVITPDSRGKSGTELRAGASLTQQLYATKDFDISGVLKVDLSWDSVRELIRPELSAELPMRFGGLDSVVLSATPFVTVGFEGGDYSLTRFGVRGALSTEIANNLIAGWSGTVYRSDYKLAPWRNSWEVENNLTLSALLNDQTRLTGSVSMGHYLNDDDTRNSRTLSASLRLDHMMKWGLIVGLQGKVGRRDYVSAPAPTIGSFQEDTFYSGRVEVSHRDVVLGPVFGSNIRPVLFYEYTNQTSNNVFYDYEGHDIGLTMRVAF